MKKNNRELVGIVGFIERLTKILSLNENIDSKGLSHAISRLPARPELYEKKDWEEKNYPLSDIIRQIAWCLYIINETLDSDIVREAQKILERYSKKL